MQTLRHTLLAAFLAVIAVLGIASNTRAQRINQMTISTNTGFTDIVGQKGVTQIYSGGSYSFTFTMGMPFNFAFDNTTYSTGSTLYIYNGCASFTSYGLAYFPVMDPSYFGYTAQQAPNTMAPYSGLQISGGVYYLVSGSAPYRMLTIEWYQNGNYPDRSQGTCSIQLVMYETSNQIDFNYEKYGLNMAYSSYTYYSQQTGLNGNTTPSFIQVAINKDIYNTYTPKSNYRFSLVPPIELSTSPKLIKFPALNIGVPATATVAVTNVASDPLAGNLIVSGTSISGDPDFTVLSVPGALPPGKSGNVTVQFKPIAEGTRAAVLSIITNGRDSGTQTITLTGTSLAPLIAVDTTILFKKTTTKLGGSLTRKVAIHSIGSASLLWTGFALTGVDANQYSVTRLPSVNPIPVGAWDTVGVTYTPTIEGRRAANLIIQSNALNNPAVNVQLIGTGILPHIVVTPNAIRFDSTYEGDTARQVVTVWNPGTDTLIITQNILAGADPDFHLTGLSNSDLMIPPDKTVAVTVTFIPVQMGTRQGRLLFKTNIPLTFEAVKRDTAGTISIPIYGNGVPFGMLSQSIAGATYDTTAKGVSVCRVDTIRNDGDADVVLNGWSITGSNTSDFSATGITFPYKLKSHSMVIVNVCGTPSDFGLRTANLAINGASSGKNVSISLGLNVYGLKVCATADPSGLFTNEYVVENSDSTQCVTVTNCGELPAVYTVNLSNNADYVLTSPSQSASIPSGGTATFCVKFHPNTYGASNASMTIATPNIPNIVVPITGIGACANVSAPQPTIASIGSGGHQPFTITFSNAGNYTWTADGSNKPTITPNNGVFTIGDVTPIAGNNGQLVVNGLFNPTDINQNYTAQVSFPNAAPSCASAVTVTLSASSTGLSVDKQVEQAGFALGQNYPNPFASATTFNYTTPTEAPVTITINDVTGHLVRTIASGRVSAGEHTVSIDANDLASGTYVVTLTSGNVRLARQVVITK